MAHGTENVVDSDVDYLLTKAWLRKGRIIPDFVPGGLLLENGRITFIGTLAGSEGPYFDAAVDKIESVHWRPWLAEVKLTISGEPYALCFVRPTYGPDANLSKLDTAESPTAYIGDIGTRVLGRVTGDGPGIGELVGGTFSVVKGYRTANLWRSVLPNSGLR